MKSLFVSFAVSVVVIIAFSCGNKTSFKKTAGGMPYKIFRSKDTQQVQPGDYIKLWVTQKVNDSVVLEVNKGVPLYIFVSNQGTPKSYDISELWTSLHPGDSVVTVQMRDSFIKKAPQNMPSQYKKGDRITTMIKVLGIFSSDSLGRADEDTMRKAYLAGEIKEIEKYLADNKILAQKTPSGAFVQILKQGTGDEIDT